MIEISSLTAKTYREDIADAVFVLPDAMAFFKEEWVRAKGWKIALVECKFQDENHILSRACRLKDWKCGISLTLTGEVIPDYQLDLDHVSLSSMKKFYVAPSYAIIEQDWRFVLISDCDYYWAIASDPDFIQSMFEDPLRAIAEFNEGVAPYVKGDLTSKRIGTQLLKFGAIAEASWSS